MVNKTKLRSYSTATKFKSGYQVAINYAEKVCLDKRNSNSTWQEAIDLELQQIYEYNIFVDLGLHISAKVPQDYRKIWVHFVFDVKHDGKQKARLVANGHSTAVPLQSVYSGAVSAHGFRLVMLMSE
jgi:hypothetical protein